MTKIYNFIKLTCVLLTLFSVKANAQCFQTYVFGSATINSAAPGNTIVSTCNYGGDKSTLNFNVVGSFTIMSSTAGDYFTVTDLSNNVLVTGFAPLATAIPSVGSYYLHISSSGPPSCGAAQSCRTVSIDVPLPTCAGTPTAGTVPASFSICPNTSTFLNATGATIASGITYQWMQAPAASGPWTNVTAGSGFTTTSLTTASLTTLTFYQMVITCTNSSQSATTSIVSVNPNNPVTLCYCQQNLGGSGCLPGDIITNVSILNTPLNNNSTCNSNATNGTYSQFTPGPSTTATLTLGATYTISVYTTTNNIESVWIDYNQSGTFDANEHTQICITSTANAATQATFTVPGTALLGQTGMRVRSRGVSNPNGPTDACTGFGSGETEDYVVTIAAGSACSGAPAANSAVASLTTVCPNSSVTLGLANSYTVSGLTYQWFSAPAVSGPYTSISSATSAAYTATNLTSNTFFQVVITCTNGPASTTATPVQVQVSGNPCQCGAYCLTSAPFSVNDDEIFNVTIGTLNNPSTCGQTGGPTSTVSLYSNYAGMVASPNLAAGVNYTFNVTVGQCNANPYSGGLTIYMDFNQNGSFADLGEQVYASASTLWAVSGTNMTGTITIPTNATLGTTRMRVIAAEANIGILSCNSYGYGETEDYCITITAPTPCAGNPGANSAVTTITTVCPSGTVGLSLANSYTVGGLSYQWFSSPAISGPYTAISTATNTSAYTVTNITTSLYYQAVITCTNGPASTTSTPVQVVVNNNPCQCSAYCASNATQPMYDEIWNVTIGTLNNSSTCSQTGGPTSVLNQYSNYAGIVAAPTLSAGTSYNFSVTVGMCSTTFAYPGIVAVYMDFNNNGLFSDPGELAFTSPSTTFSATGTTIGGNIAIPPTAVGGVTRMRVIEVEYASTAPLDCATYYAGETEDYCINIIAAPPCSGTPNPGTITATQTLVCSGTGVNMNITGFSVNSGLTFQWQTSPNSTGPWTSVSGATNTAYSTSITANSFYQVIVSCGTNTAVTASVQFSLLPVTACYCNQNLGGSGCSPSDIITNVSILSTPLNNNSTCNSSPTNGTYTQFLQGPTTTATLNLTATYTISVYTTADNIESVWIDYDHSGTFDAIEHTQICTTSIPNSATTATFTVPGTAQLGLTGMRVRSRGVFNQNGPTDACTGFGSGETEDYFITIAPNCTVPNLTLTASQNTICNGSAVTLTASGATTYTWNTNAQTAIISVTPSVNTTYTVNGENTPGCPGTKTIAITVKPSPTLTVVASPSICPGGNAVLSATSSATNYTWTPGNFNTAAITVSPSISSVYNVATTNSVGCVTNSNVTVFVIVCTGIAKNTVVDNNTFIYPNPNSGNINVVIQDANGNYSFEILDLAGRVVYKTTLLKAENALSIKELANGMYTYKITSLTTKVAIKEGKLIKE